MDVSVTNFPKVNITAQKDHMYTVLSEKFVKS
jgi:hypothetical protein